MIFTHNVLRCFLVITLALIAIPRHAPAAFDKEEEEKKESSSKGNMPAEVEEAISALFKAVPNGSPTPDAAAMAPLLDFMANPAMQSDAVHPDKREYGKGAFFTSKFNTPLRRFIQYCFNPAIPGEAVYPTVIRRNKWQPGSQILNMDVPLWKKAERIDSPTVIRGSEFEEITPDTFSGSYYSYTLQRLLILTTHKGRAVLVSVAVQDEPSSVGLKGAVVGKDSDWNYIYTNKQGSTLKLAGWADTYMYSAASIIVYAESAPGARTMELYAVKYLKAGWAKINMVEPKHILSGAKRFIAGLKQVLDSPSLPSPEEIINKKKQLSDMDMGALREAVNQYGVLLAEQADKANLSDSDFKKALDNGNYAAHMSRENMVSELLKQYMKQRPGLAAAPAVR